MPVYNPTPTQAVRAEFRAALHDIADALLDGAEPARLADAVRHAWVLADLGEVGEGLARSLLRDLARELKRPTALDRPRLSHQFTMAADRLD